MTNIFLNDVSSENSSFRDDKPLTYKRREYVKIEQNNKNLTNIVSEFKAEIIQLKEKAERDKYEILLLKHSIKTRNKNIANLNEELQTVKQEKNELAQQVEIQDQNYQILLESRMTEINVKDIEIWDLMEEIDKLKAEISELKHEKPQLASTRKKTKETDNYENEPYLKIQQSKANMSKAKSAEGRMYEMKRKDELIEKTFSWAISDIHDKREQGEALKSNYFFVKMNPYKLQLILVNYGSTLKIRLLIHSTSSDSELSWPFNAEVTIKIVNSASPGMYKKLTENRCVEKPSIGSFRSSKPFEFSYIDLFTSELLEWNCFTVECYIVLI